MTAFCSPMLNARTASDKNKCRGPAKIGTMRSNIASSSTGNANRLSRLRRRSQFTTTAQNVAPARKLRRTNAGRSKSDTPTVSKSAASVATMPDICDVNCRSDRYPLTSTVPAVNASRAASCQFAALDRSRPAMRRSGIASVHPPHAYCFFTESQRRSIPQRLARHVSLRYLFTVHRNRILRNLPRRLSRGCGKSRKHQQLRQLHDTVRHESISTRRHLNLGQIFRNCLLLKLRRPTLRRLLRRLCSMEARRNRQRQLLLDVHRIHRAVRRPLPHRVNLRLPQVRQKRPILPHQLIGDRHQLAVHLRRRLLDADRIVQRLRHLLHAVQALQDRGHQDDLWLLPEVTLQIAPAHEVELLIRAAQLHIALQRYGVVPLRD